MATPAQLAANRANALRSTGPRTQEGKSVSRFNALKHGVDAQSIVIPGEDPAEYQALAGEYDQTYEPRNPAERFHVDAMLRADWQRRRMEQVEAELFRTLLAENPGLSLAAALLTESKTARLLARIERQVAAHQRTWYRAHSEFQKDRARRTPPDDPTPAKQNLASIRTTSADPDQAAPVAPPNLPAQPSEGSSEDPRWPKAA
jgi:hypothetical protein